MSARAIGSLPLVLGLLVAAPVGLSSCADLFEDRGLKVEEPDSGVPAAYPGGGVGQRCAGDSSCRAGLACRGTPLQCVPRGDRIPGQRCLLSAECADGLACGVSGFCVEAGEGAEGAACSSSADCVQGFECGLSGLAGFCEPRPADGGDLDNTCATSADCRAGLVCSGVSSTCVPGSLLLNPDLFQGVVCPQDELEQPFGVRMELPRAARPRPDFYRFPFPSDVHLDNGVPAIEGHPVPGPGLLGLDPLATALGSLAPRGDGWGVNPAVFFRFTRPVDPGSLKTGAEGGSVRFVDLDSGDEHPATAHFSVERNKYICANYLRVQPLWSRPLEPGHRYAVVLTRSVRTAAGATGGAGRGAEPLDDVGLLLSATPPSESATRPAWQTYAPLREWLGPATVSPGDVVAATVFTVGDPRRRLLALAETVQQRSAPQVVDGSLTLCAPGVASPCATPGWADSEPGQQGLPDPRACPAAAREGWHEVHLRLRLPAFQDGTPPFLEAGGAITLEPGGGARVEREEDVCVALVVPAGAAPPGGWPLVVYGHGTGGSFRSGAHALAAEVVGLGAALVSVDQPLHGDRAGEGAGGDPGPLVFNYGNPEASRGNLLQGAADLLGLMRFAAGLQMDVPGVGAVSLTNERIAYMGHSQGATTGALAASTGPEGLRGAVFSGLGGSLVYSLLGKTVPYDASVGLRMALHEIALDANHPVLHLLQLAFEETDPLSHARHIALQPRGRPLHVLNVLGWDDHFSPWRTGSILAAALGGTLAFPDGKPDDVETDGLHPADDLGLQVAASPLVGNVSVGEQDYTVAHLAGTADGDYDGHYLVMYHADVQRRVLHYLAGLLGSDEPPELVE